jgi:hypothetical protein
MIRSNIRVNTSTAQAWTSHSLERHGPVSRAVLLWPVRTGHRLTGDGNIRRRRTWSRPCYSDRCVRASNNPTADLTERYLPCVGHCVLTGEWRSADRLTVASQAGRCCTGTANFCGLLPATVHCCTHVQAWAEPERQEHAWFYQSQMYFFCTGARMLSIRFKNPITVLYIDARPGTMSSSS